MCLKPKNNKSLSSKKIDFDKNKSVDNESCNTHEPKPSLVDKLKNSPVFIAFYLFFIILFIVLFVFSVFFDKDKSTASADVRSTFPDIVVNDPNNYPSVGSPFSYPVFYRGSDIPRNFFSGFGSTAPSGVEITFPDFDNNRLNMFHIDSYKYDWMTVTKYTFDIGSNRETAQITLHGVEGILLTLVYNLNASDSTFMTLTSIRTNTATGTSGYDYFSLYMFPPHPPITSRQGYARAIIYRSLRSLYYFDGYNSGHINGYNQGYSDGSSTNITAANPVTFFLEPVTTFLNTPIFGEFSIGLAFSVALFVSIALIFLKLFAGG